MLPLSVTAVPVPGALDVGVWSHFLLINFMLRSPAEIGDADESGSSTLLSQVTTAPANTAENVHLGYQY